MDLRHQIHVYISTVSHVQRELCTVIYRATVKKIQAEGLARLNK